jgi:two-component system, NtrC family, nitrogen regulation response regulator GlnG
LPVASTTSAENNDLESVARVAIAQLIARASTAGKPLADLHEIVVSAVERPLFELALKETRGNQIKAAEILGLNRNTLRKRLATLEVETGKARI